MSSLSLELHTNIDNEILAAEAREPSERTGFLPPLAHAFPKPRPLPPPFPLPPVANPRNHTGDPEFPLFRCIDYSLLDDARPPRLLFACCTTDKLVTIRERWRERGGGGGGGEDARESFSASFSQRRWRTNFTDGMCECVPGDSIKSAFARRARVASLR